MMMAGPHCVLLVLLLLAGLSRFGEGNSNPGFVARITKKGLEYAQQCAVTILKKELSTVRLPDLSGSFKIGWFGQVSYNFYSLKIHHFELQNWNLNLLPKQHITASLSNNYISLGGNWKVKKAFITLQGTFDLKVYGISITVSLNLGKDQSGRPTVSMAQCSNSIGHVSVDISGSFSWILNLFHERIENNIKRVLQQKVCEMVRKSTTSYLEPYLSSLPVTVMIDDIASLDYTLLGAPQVTSEGLVIPFKGEFFNKRQPSPVPFEAPPMTLPPRQDHMIYLAVSDYTFNTASWVYHKAGYMKVIFRNEHLARSYPNMKVELEASPVSAPLLTLTPGNVTLSPVIDIKAFTLLPNSSDRRPLFQLRVNTSVSITVSVRSSRIVGSVSTSKLKLELKHSSFSDINMCDFSQHLLNGFPQSEYRGAPGDRPKDVCRLTGNGQPYLKVKQVELMETILNYYAFNTIYPSLNAKLKEGLPLPLPRQILLNNVELQIHKNFLLLGSDIDYRFG